MSENPAPRLLFDDSLGDSPPFRAALVWAEGLPCCPRREGPSPYLAELLARVRAAGEAWLPEDRKKAVRDMLRHGDYKPAGRAKPSSEYLLAAALDGSFPCVNGPVDANNALSLEFGYPASVFDAALVGSELLLKRGGEGDSYVFNASGQAIGLKDLLCVWRRSSAESGAPWLPSGNPVKDAMATKVFEACRSVIAVVYAPRSEPRNRLEACAEGFARLLKEDCGAASVGFSIVEA